ncbi:MAG: hypothetical protein ABWY93_18860 [Mycobacterium sp.]
MISNRDTLIAALGAGVTSTWSNVFLNGGHGTGPYNMGSSWLNSHRRGVIPASFNVPAVCNAATLGGIPLTTLGAGFNWYLGAFNQSTNSANSEIILFDRLAQVKINSSGGGSATFSMTRPARSTTAVGVMAYAESLGGTTAGAAWPTITVTYTNSDGVASRSGTIGGATANFGANPGQMLPMKLATGDRGVSSVQAVAFSAGVTSVGMILHLSRALSATYAPQIGTGLQRGYYELGGVALGVDPCLFTAGNLTVGGGATGSGGVQQGSIRLISG